MYKNLSYDPEQAFAPVALIAKSALIIAAKASLPVKDIKELAAYARANPGKLTVGTPGNGTLGHIPRCWCRRSWDQHNERAVSRLGAGAHRPAQRPGRPRGGFHADLRAAGARGQDPRARRHHQPTCERSPDVPTVQESGFRDSRPRPGLLWRRQGTPNEIIDKLNAATNEFLKSPKGQDALAKLSMHVVGGSPADLKAFIAAELQKWGPVVKEADISM